MTQRGFSRSIWLSCCLIILNAVTLPFAFSYPPKDKDSELVPKETHEARGVLRSIATDGMKAVIRHEPIANYMPAMTMELTVRNPRELDGLKAGDVITFCLLATDETKATRIPPPTGIFFRLASILSLIRPKSWLATREGIEGMTRASGRSPRLPILSWRP